MKTEYWATFSIYDHRTPNYRRALIVFDRIVIPVASRPYKGLTGQELDQLSAEVDFLVHEGRAVRFDWDPQRFNEWKQNLVGKGVSAHLGKHAEDDTRYQLQYEVEEGIVGLAKPADVEVLAVPVCSSVKEFEHLAEERDTLEVILDSLPVPNSDASLETICRLRDREDFATSLSKMRIWQDDVVLGLLRAGSEREREVLLRRSKAQLTDWVATYRRLVEDAGLANQSATLSAITSLGRSLAGDATAIPKLAAALGDVVGIRTARRPSWKAVADLECAPAGIIYTTEELRE